MDEEEIICLVFIILGIIIAVLLILFVLSCCRSKLRRRKRKGEINRQLFITTTQSAYQQPNEFGSNVSYPVPANIPGQVIGIGRNDNIHEPRFPNNYSTDYSYSQPTPNYSTQHCAPPSYEEIHNEAHQKQPPFNPNYAEQYVQKY